MADNATVHVIDDDEALRDSISFLLSTVGLETKLYESATAFQKEPRQGLVGCIITDVRMPGVSGIELLRQIKATSPSLPVIIMTGHGDIPLAVEAMKLGASDFIEKPFDDEVFLVCVRRALGQRELSAQKDAERASIETRLALLSTREREVLEGLVAGQANKVIAYNLSISPRTVEIYRANLMTKMQADSLSSLVRMALMAGLLGGKT